LNFIYPFKFYSNFTNKNVSWLHFSWATQYTLTLTGTAAAAAAAVSAVGCEETAG